MHAVHGRAHEDQPQGFGQVGIVEEPPVGLCQVHGRAYLASEDPVHGFGRGFGGREIAQRMEPLRRGGRGPCHGQQTFGQIQIGICATIDAPAPDQCPASLGGLRDVHPQGRHHQSVQVPRTRYEPAFECLHDREDRIVVLRCRTGLDGKTCHASKLPQIFLVLHVM